MATIYPFVVGAGEHREHEYQVIVEPRPLLGTGEPPALTATESLRRVLHSSPDVINQGAAYAAPWVAPDGTLVTVVWRPTLSAAAYWLGSSEIAMRDLHGRLIRVDEGFFCPVGYVPTESDFETVHEVCQPHFERFWQSVPPWAPTSAGPITREAVDRVEVVRLLTIDAPTVISSVAVPTAAPCTRWRSSYTLTLPPEFRRDAHLTHVPGSNAIVIAARNRVGVCYPDRQASMPLRELGVSPCGPVVHCPDTSDVAFPTAGSFNLLSTRREPILRSLVAPTIVPGSLVGVARSWEAVSVSRFGLTIWRWFPVVEWQAAERPAELGPVTALHVPHYGWCEPATERVRLVTGDRDGRVRSYTALDATGPYVAVADLGRPIEALALSRDHDRILSSAGTLVTLHRAGGDAITLHDADAPVLASGFVIDGAGGEIAWTITAAGVLLEWDARSGERARQVGIGCGRVVAAARSTAGDSLFTLSAAGRLQSWEAETVHASVSVTHVPQPQVEHRERMPPLVHVLERF